jgi:predicted enzyme related to lactoylglutathione lyase
VTTIDRGRPGAALASTDERSPMATSSAIVAGVDFVVVPTRDFDASVAFYGTVLGLPCTARYDHMPGAEFETGTLTLAVMATESFGMGFSPNRNPIALQVDDYEAARTELESRGVTFTSDTIDSGICHMASFDDPAGNVLMIHQRYAPRAATV